MKVSAAADTIVGRLDTNKKLATFRASEAATVVTGGNVLLTKDGMFRGDLRVLLKRFNVNWALK
jgi:hypothetical protein